jgi:hypothetical protein
VPTVTTSPVPTVTTSPVPTVTTSPVSTVTTSPVPTVTTSPVPTVTTSPVPTVTTSPVPTVTTSPVPTVTTSPVPTVTTSPVPTETPSPVPTPGEAPHLELSLPPSIAVGSLVQTQLNASGGSGSYVYQSTGQLPSGLVLLADGRLEGQVTQVGTYTFTIIVTDSNGQTASYTYEIVVEPMRIFVPVIMRAAP